MNLPKAEDVCGSASLAVCSSRDLLNQLDGFSVNPRVMVCFSGPIDPTTVAAGISIVPAGQVAPVVKINQVIIDDEHNCVFAKPDKVLDQQSRYLVLVRSAVRDTRGNAVTADSNFIACLQGRDAYCASLAAAIAPVMQASGSSDAVVGASLFTTLSATSWLQGAYDFVNNNQLGVVLPASFPWVFPVRNLQSFTWNPANAAIGPQSIPVNTALKNVGSIAFGFYFSPNYLNISGDAAGSITTAPNRPVPVLQVLAGLTFGFVPISFHVFLPDSPPPPGGYPVVIYGHGLGDSQYGAPTYMASTLAASGYATLAMEIMGHGYGSGSTVTLQYPFGMSYQVSTPGRGIQLTPGQPIASTDGCILPGPLAVRDCGRQTAVDLFALIKTIQRSNGLTLGLNSNAIYYVGQSFGSIYGTLLHAVSPDVKTAVLNAGGGPFVDVARLAINGRLLGQQYLCGLQLLNVNPTPAQLATCPNGFTYAGAPSQDYFHDTFNDNYVYRDQPPVVNTVPGAIEIQSAFEAAEWLGMLGDALSYAPHLKTSPLPNVPVKSTLFQFSDGDLEVPNPTNLALERAADAKNSSMRFRFVDALGPDPSFLALAGIMDPAVPFPILPHRILSNPTIFGTGSTSDFGIALEQPIALAEQRATAAYFQSNGQTLPNANSFLQGPYQGRILFDNTGDLPPGLNFVQIPK